MSGESVTIKELRNTVASRLGQSSSLPGAQSGRGFQSICSNYKSHLKGYVCLHWRNYKTVLIDNTSWIYCEFVASEAADNNIYLSSSHMLSLIQVDTFNVCVEKLATKGFNKEIYYLQIDLSNCVVVNNVDTTPPSSSYFNSEESRLSYAKTSELMRCCCSMPDDQEAVTLNHSYLMRIVHKSSVYSLANSQFKTKLRADVVVDLIDNSDRNNTTHTILLTLMSKFLVHYALFHPERVYLLKTSNKLKLSRNMEQVFMDETMFVMEETQITSTVRIKPKFQISQVCLSGGVTDKENSISRQTADTYINMLSGVLMEKTLPEQQSTFTYADKNDLNQVLASHFDLILPNKEIKLVIKPHESNCLFTVYFDTHYSVYPLSILPGMEIKILNLIRKSPRVYKAKSCVQVCYKQNFDVFKTTTTTTGPQLYSSKSSQSSRLYDSLCGLNRIFNTFYDHRGKSNSESSSSCSSIDQSSLLFQNYDPEKLYSNDGGHQSEYRFLAQLIRIYDFELRVKCGQCDRLFSSCCCSQPQDVYELKASFMIDDHTSQLRINYTNSNIDLASSSGSSGSSLGNMFSPIAKSLVYILKKYLNEIQIATVPIYHRGDNFDPVDLNTKLNQMFKEKLNSNNNNNSSAVEASTSSTSLLGGGLNESHFFFENNVKLDIYKTVYDFLLHTVLNKYFVFYIDPNDPVNSKEVYSHSSLSHNLNKSSSSSSSEYSNFKPKCEFNYVRLNSLESSEQFKSTLRLKCFKFVPATLAFNF